MNRIGLMDRIDFWGLVAWMFAAAMCTWMLMGPAPAETAGDASSREHVVALAASGLNRVFIATESKSGKDLASRVYLCETNGLEPDGAERSFQAKEWACTVVKFF